MTSLRLFTAIALALSTVVLSACGGAVSSDIDSGTDAARTDAAVSDDAAVAPDAPGTVDAAMTADTGSTDAAPVGDAGGEFAGSFIQQSCGPADGPAFQLDLFEASVAACTVDDTRRTIGFYVHDLGGATVPPTAGTVIASTPSTAHGTANRCPGGTPPCDSTETWTLTFESYVVGTGAVGTYSVTWGDGTTSTGQFDAGWCGDRPLCG